MKRLLLLGIALMALLLSGCKKNDVKPGDAVSDYYAFIDQMKESPKTYMIHSYSTIHTNPEEYASQTTASIKGNNEPNGLSINEFHLNFPAYFYNQDGDVSFGDTINHMNSLYGKKYNLKFETDYLNAKSDESIANPSGQLYIPELLYPVSYENLTADEKITVGSTIRWNKDDKNKNGILINLAYFPSTQSDLQNRIYFPEYIRKGKIVSDDGEYTFEQSDFAGFPPNADIDFTIERINHTTFQDERGDNCTFVSIDKTGAGFTISIEE
ncbi:MAG: hypothetical protein L3J66_12265 [Bacteroidales bacterium]|nr:hypothetical protein [Bacteroidales bacterium]